MRPRSQRRQGWCKGGNYISKNRVSPEPKILLLYRRCCTTCHLPGSIITGPGPVGPEILVQIFSLSQPTDRMMKNVTRSIMEQEDCFSLTGISPG